METFSFKISETEKQALNILTNRWCCNRAEAARKALQLAQKHTEQSTDSAINPDQLQAIVETQKQTIELLGELTKFRPLIARINRLEEYTVQACLSSGMLAKQAGVFDTAKNEFNIWKQQREENI